MRNRKGYPLDYPVDCLGGEGRGPLSGPRSLGVSVTGLCENRETVCDQLNSVSLALLGIVGILADPADDMNQIALVGLGSTLDMSSEQRHLVPMGVGRPLAVVLAVVVRRHRNLRHFVMLVDLADAADDAKLSDIRKRSKSPTWY